MPKLSDILYDANKAAQQTGLTTVKLQGGLMIVLDYRDPAAHQVRLGRKWPTWPSSVELSTIRRYVEIPPGATIERSERVGEHATWNVVAYVWQEAIKTYK